MLLGLIVSRIVVADQGEHTGTTERKMHEPYCGMYCLYTVMKLSDQRIDFRDLIKPEYIGSGKGSSLAELKKAAKDNGLYAESVAKLTSLMLRKVPYSVILHVKSSLDKKDYDHFELFLGTEGGQAKLFNPPEAARLVPFYELAPRWDGTGLVLSSKPLDLGAIYAPARNRLVLYMLVVIPVILMVHYGKQRWLTSSSSISWRKSFWLTMVQAAGFVIFAMVWGMTYHFVNEEGFLAHANATASVQNAHLGSFIPKVDKKKVEQLLNRDTVFIDARTANDFKAGHLENAINVPVDANNMERRKAMAGIGKDAPIVIYCQSNGCPFAEKVTKELKGDGFSNISIFKGGWNEWEGKKR
jgi:rhodanese-related sulfurtransferase